VSTHLEILDLFGYYESCGIIAGEVGAGGDLILFTS